MKPGKKTIIWAAAALVASLGIILVISRGRSAMSNAFNLETARTEYRTISNSVTATGTVEPVVKVEVGTQVSGIISRIYVDYNSVVYKGELLAEMDKVNLEAELVSKEADLAAAKTQYEYQEKNYARSRTLHEKELISESDFETATYNYLQAKSTYDRSRSDMTKVRRNLEYAIITSPIDGIVIERAVEQGQTVAAGFSTPTLFTIANDLTQMRVIANVDEADIGQVEEGQKVTFTVDAYPNDVFEGMVTQVRLQASITSNVVTYEVVVSAPNPDLKLKPGLTANITIFTMERPNVLTVPAKALRYIPDAEQLSVIGIKVVDIDRQAVPGRKIIWKKAGAELHPVEVSTGISTLNSVEVLEGINEGEEVVTDLQFTLPSAPQGGGGLMPRPGGRR
jgi:HlyD family secretion protein